MGTNFNDLWNDPTFITEDERQKIDKMVSLVVRHAYPAIFHPEEVGGYSVDFPDLPGCVTEGDTLPEAVSMAEEALSLYLEALEADNELAPAPSAPADIKAEGNDFVRLIRCSQ